MFRRILVALKLNATGRHVLRVAADLARLHGASLHVFHALDCHLLDRPADDPVLQRACQLARTEFDAARGPDDPAMDFRCAPDDPALGACRLARELNADLLVMGCHQGDCLARMDLTGVTIVEKAPCPVLIVPHREPAAPQPA